MNVISHCRAMAAFCRQRAQFENEDTLFWTAEAEEWDDLIARYSIRQLPLVPAKMSKLRTFHAE
jgi:hypothetical protein